MENDASKKFKGVETYQSCSRSVINAHCRDGTFVRIGSSKAQESRGKYSGKRLPRSKVVECCIAVVAST